MKVSLIISVYKNIRDLEIVLEGLKFQTFKEFEVVISEDGQDNAVANFVAGYNYANPMRHVSQPDVGWRKNQALNNAIRNASGDYLIFIDGDCVLHHKFIEHHVRFSSRDRVLAGKRVKLGPGYSNLFRENISDLPELEKRVARESRRVKKDGAKFYEEAFYINPDGMLGFITRLRKMTNLKGCNMSAHREAFEKINGFDEDYILPAIGEDIDLTWRFKGVGIQIFSLRNLAVQYHLYHKENWSDQSENEKLMQSKQRMQKFVCSNGLRKL
jgi:cellulose synthase/poly-beta-1,6-N-acetylglucosamine synthase-like glycosyltransferase